jgi:hypothetical protein
VQGRDDRHAGRAEHRHSLQKVAARGTIVVHADLLAKRVQPTRGVAYLNRGRIAA